MVFALSMTKSERLIIETSCSQTNVELYLKRETKLSRFVSAIWQTHPFREGNTRTVSTFLILYLRSIGIPADNGPFKKHADWFRDALVRSNYANIRKGIYPEFSYLETFFENVLLGAKHDLEAMELTIFQ